MSEGITFGPAESKITTTYGYATSIESSTTATFTQSGSAKLKVNCGVVGGETAGIWQWVTKTNDGLAMAYTALTICRYGEGAMFNTPPECPYPACADSMCTECSHDWWE